ncbi:MAG TPA: DUF3105 domain-containing protein [Solirubrobacteraceae bacterium]|nr:DUF3105 domain-containing protein [Solirubrobacteraceae bacterium]
MRLLERLAIVLVSLAIATAVIVLLSGGPLTGHDNPGLSGPSNQIGLSYRDLGDAHLKPGARPPHYDSDPPTSGPHVAVAVRHDGTTISNDQLLQALELGNVVVLYGTRQPPRDLRRLAGSVAAPFSPALAAAGQAVIVAQRPGTRGLVALAWTRLLHVKSAVDRQLRSFILFWLGHGAPRPDN